jgi:DNA-binding CsgD family transcriptional regulator
MTRSVAVHASGGQGNRCDPAVSRSPQHPITPSPAAHPSPAADIHLGWLTAGKRAAAGGDGPLASAPDDAAFAEALASLTKRQQQIVRLRARGLTIAEIGDRYYLSDNTIKNHLRAAFGALGLDTLRHQARLGRACYLLGRYDAARVGKSRSREEDGKTARRQGRAKSVSR